MTIYIDNECKCHVSNHNDVYTAIEAPPEFKDKAPAYIEGFRVKPEGYTYTREDGKTFGPGGYSVSPWRDLALLNEFQTQYETQRHTIIEYEVALSEIETALGVNAE